MNYTRTSFMIGVALSGAIWLLCMFLGGEGWGPDERARMLFAAGTDAGRRDLAGQAAWLGSWWAVGGATLLAAIYLVFRRRRRAALLMIAVVIGWLLVLIQKMLVDRDMPDLPKYLEAAHSMSFPSELAANSMLTYLMIALMLPGRRWINAIQITVALLLTIAAGWSPLALEQTWASDVVGGWAFGFLWVIVVVRLATDRPGN